MAYETKEGDFIINDNGGKKKSESDPDGKGKLFYNGQHYKLNLYVNKEKKTEKHPDFTGAVDINGEQCKISLYQAHEKKTEKHPDLWGYLVVGKMQYRMGAWQRSGRYGVFWSGQVTGENNAIPDWGINGKLLEGRYQQQSNGGMGGMNASSGQSSGGMGGGVQSNNSYGSGPVDDFDDSEIPF